MWSCWQQKMDFEKDNFGSFVLCNLSAFCFHNDLTVECPAFVFFSGGSMVYYCNSFLSLRNGSPKLA